MQFNKTIKKLIIGKRPFPKRLQAAALPAFALSFILFFFGPLDLSYVSRNFVSYSAPEILPQTALLTGAVFVILLLAAAVPGGQVHAFLVSVYTGLSFAMYVQGAFLNPDFGVLDGTSVNWPSFSTLMTVNLAVWFVILLIPHLVHTFSIRVWRGFVMILSAVLILMQGVSLGVKLADQMRTDRTRGNEYIMSNADMLSLGKDKNTVVFLLDAFSNDYLDFIESGHENVMYPLRDFTRFDNAGTHYQRTVPSVANLLTSVTWNGSEEGYKDYLRRAWTSDAVRDFYGTLKKNHFSVDIYALQNEIVSDLSDIAEIADNVQQAGQGKHLVYRAFLNLIKLTFYRYFPICMKPFFVIYSTDIVTMFSAENVYVNQWDLVEKYSSGPLRTGKENSFIFYYLQGIHHPYHMDETGHGLAGTTTQEASALGFINLIGTYIHQMKELGIYDSAEIIILADHGASPVMGGEAGSKYDDSDFQPILLVKRPGESHDSYVRDHAPVTIQEQFFAEVLQGMGLEAGKSGPSYFDVPETEPAERWACFYASAGGGNYVFRQYRYTGDGRALNEKIAEGDYTVIPLLDSFY